MRLLIVLVSLTLSSFLIFFIQQQSKYEGSVYGIAGKITDVQVSLSIGLGGAGFKLYGYTSPSALVKIEGVGVFDETRADTKGYFEFLSRFSLPQAKEICLSSQDQFGRISQPVCLPPLPRNYFITIGPVILPPTLSLNKNEYYVGDQVVLSGQSIPQTDVNLSLYKAADQSEAFSFPQLGAKTDMEGNFSISLPSAQSLKYRLFTNVSFKKQRSSQSNPLTFDVLPWWMLIIKLLFFLLGILKERLLEILIISELVSLLVYFLRSRFLYHGVPITRALIIYHSAFLAVRPEHEIVLRKGE